MQIIAVLASIVSRKKVTTFPLQLVEMFPEVATVNEVQQFFTDIWGPMVCRLHTPGGSIIPAFFSDVMGVLESLSIQEVRFLYDFGCIHN